MTVLLYCPAATSVKYCKYPSIAEQKLPTKFTQNFPSKNTRTGISLFFLFLSLFFFLTISSFIGIVFFFLFFFSFFFFFFFIIKRDHLSLHLHLLTFSLSLSLSLSSSRLSLFSSSLVSLLFSPPSSLALYLYYRLIQLSLLLPSSSRSIPTD